MHENKITSYYANYILLEMKNKTEETERVIQGEIRNLITDL
jgi:hypothetical protein